MEYITDRDFPNPYADRVNVGLYDTRDNTLSSSKEQLKEPCDNFGKLLLNRVTLILTLRGYNLKDFLLLVVQRQKQLQIDTVFKNIYM